MLTHNRHLINQSLSHYNVRHRPSLVHISNSYILLMANSIKELQYQYSQGPVKWQQLSGFD